MITRTVRPLLSGLALGLLMLGAAQAENLSAPAAESALRQGALAWDVRAQPDAGLPGALHIDAASLEAWLQHHDLEALQAAVSHAGLDLSRDIVVYGEAGDARAQALVASLQKLSSGRVHWLVGGATEWAMSGRELRSTRDARLPVPQRLVAADDAGPKQMASAALRSPRQDLTLLAAR